MKRRHFILLAIVICITALNTIFYNTFTKTMYIKNGNALVNSQQTTPQLLFEMTAHVISLKYIEPDLNHQDWQYWLDRYKGKINTDADAQVAIDTMIASLDEPYTHFMPKDDFDKLTTSIASKIFGIGVNIFDDAGKITVFSVIADTPAEQAELKPNDIILKVNKTECSGKKINDVANLIRGKEGSTVELEIKRGNQTLTKNIKREEIKIKTIETLVEDDIGYINLNSFLSSNMEGELEAALEKTKDTKGLIIDLRWNTGGLLNNAVTLANTFIPEGPIVSVVSRNGKKEVISADKNKPKIDKPVVILINEASASASEIFSGAMKDYNRATLIGHKSFGKGMVQSVIPLPNKTGVNITIAKYLTPLNHDINNKGITPHIYVDPTLGSIKRENDKQLIAAKKEIKKLINNKTETRISKKM